MAPTSNSATVLQQNRLHPTVARRVLPAIPLPYIQKRKQQEAAKTKAKARDREQAQAATPVPVEIEIETPPPQTPPTSQITPGAVNEPQEHHSEIVESSVEPSLPDTPLTPPTIEIEVQTEASAEVSSAREETPEPSQDTPRSIRSESQSSVSRSTYQMPPPFIPATQQQQNGVHYEPVAATQPHIYNGQLSMHHSHPSNGGSIIHGYSASNHSSPAPPLSGGNIPPYPYQQQHPAGRHAPHHSNGVPLQQLPMGYAIMGPPPTPFPPSINHGPSADNLARHHMNSQSPPESYSHSGAPPGIEPRGNGYPPSAPRSLHGSQSSVTNDHESASVTYYGPHATAVISNGSNGQIDEVRVHRPQKSRPESQSVSGPNNFSDNPTHLIDQFDGLISYLQSQFNDPTLADYRIELRFSDDRAQPVRIFGHGLIIARSPTLRKLMDDCARENSTDGLALASHTLLLVSGDRFLTSDGFWMAMRRLYGHGLLDLGFFNRPDPGSLPPPPKDDQLTFALGYAAAGQVLQMPPVTTRGIDFIANMLDFSTLERTLDFALDGGLSHQWMAQQQVDRELYPSTYGPSVNPLIHRCLSLIVDKFPTDFVLDTSVSDPAYRRLPSIAEPTRPASRNPRLNMIQFGYAEEEPKGPSGISLNCIISRVLFNLPFHLLKYVFESKLPGGDGASAFQARQDLVRCVVDEREKRRLKHRAAHAQGREATGNPRQWEAAGWEEQVGVREFGNQAATILVLSRVWVN